MSAASTNGNIVCTTIANIASAAHAVNQLFEDLLIRSNERIVSTAAHGMTRVPPK